VDNSSSADILTWQCFSGMGFKKEDLKKAERPLYGFGNKRIEALGKIDVNVTFGQDATMSTEVITFDVVDFVYPYNAIFGRNTINKFAAVVTTPPEIIPYYRLNHSIWSLSDNKEASR
jgi:hypothetical protein